MEYKGRNVCPKCKRAYVKWIDVCPKCKTPIGNNDIFGNSRNYYFEQKEGEGRKYGAGGAACNYCPYCNGTKDWCPIMD